MVVLVQQNLKATLDVKEKNLRASGEAP